MSLLSLYHLIRHLLFYSFYFFILVNDRIILNNRLQESAFDEAFPSPPIFSEGFDRPPLLLQNCAVARDHSRFVQSVLQKNRPKKGRLFYIHQEKLSRNVSKPFDPTTVFPYSLMRKIDTSDSSPYSNTWLTISSCSSSVYWLSNLR